ncbi:unnamed protein product [Calicophoron daubneyi]|uniref:Uncharacterized protein n=1 Tax=Calicophoron daubneyi TaxID=300641 RepID=A0AAV2TNS8_CALDB
MDSCLFLSSPMSSDSVCTSAPVSRSPSPKQISVDSDLDYLTTLYIRFALIVCIIVGIFVLSRPFSEPFIIRMIFGEKLNYCNYTYVPSVNNYRRPYKTYL